MEPSDFEGATVHFHNDADGCCSAAVVCARLKKFSLKAHMDPNARSLSAGKNLVLDMGGLTAEQVQGKDVTLIDHHKTEKLPCVHINPRFVGEDFPASFACWLLFGDEKTAWIAGAGVIGDCGVMQAKPLFELIQETNPELVPKKIGQEELYRSPLGTISRMVDANCSINGEAAGENNVRTLISLSPAQILAGEGPASRMKKALDERDAEIESILGNAPEEFGRLILLRYKGGHSVKSEVANELIRRNPDKIIMVAQEVEGHVRASLRGRDVDLSEMAKKATEGIGVGGGHPPAAGLTVPKIRFEEVLSRIRAALEESK